MPRMKKPATSTVLAACNQSVSLPMLARRWKIKQRKLRLLLGRGELPFVQVQGEIRVPLEAVEQRELAEQLPSSDELENPD